MDKLPEYPTKVVPALVRVKLEGTETLPIASICADSVWVVVPVALRRNAGARIKIAATRAKRGSIAHESVVRSENIATSSACDEIQRPCFSRSSRNRRFIRLTLVP